MKQTYVKTTICASDCIMCHMVSLFCWPEVDRLPYLCGAVWVRYSIVVGETLLSVHIEVDTFGHACASLDVVVFTSIVLFVAAWFFKEGF